MRFRHIFTILTSLSLSIVVTTTCVAATASGSLEEGGATSPSDWMRVQNVVKTLVDHGTELDQNFSTVMRAPDQSLSIWTSTGTASDALLEIVRKSGAPFAMRKSLLNRTQQQTIETAVIAAMYAHERFADGAVVAGFGRSFTGQQIVYMCKVNPSVKAAVEKRFDLHGVQAVTVVIKPTWNIPF
jgi:hypothetical protein